VLDLTHTKVDPEQLGKTARNIEGNLNGLENAFRTVEDTLLNTLKPSWEDDAAKLFFQQYFLDAQTFASHLKSLHSFNEQLKTAAGIYDDADQKAFELVGKIRVT
jgi:WXG100 family type VII secretion target